MMRLDGQVALVTGATGQIGGAIAHTLAAAGAALVLPHRAGAAPPAIDAAGSAVLACVADLASEAGAAQLLAQAEHAFGHVDLLVNAAGSYPAQPLAQLGLAEWRAMFAANLDTAFLCSQAVPPGMRRRGGGAIVNVASVAALVPAPAHAHYASAKAGLLAWTRACAQECGEWGIRVNAVAPGLIERPGLAAEWPEGLARWNARAPLRGAGSAQDVAHACLFLASPAARFITGHTLVVDGGMLVAPLY